MKMLLKKIVIVFLLFMFGNKVDAICLIHVGEELLLKVLRGYDKANLSKFNSCSLWKRNEWQVIPGLEIRVEPYLDDRYLGRTLVAALPSGIFIRTSEFLYLFFPTAFEPEAVILERLQKMLDERAEGLIVPRFEVVESESEKTYTFFDLSLLGALSSPDDFIPIRLAYGLGDEYLPKTPENGFGSSFYPFA